MQNVKKRLVSMLLAFTMIFGLCPMTAFADDTRTVVSAIVGTSSNVDTLPVYGAAASVPEFTLTAGMPAYMWSPSSHWQRYVDDTWKNVDTSETFRSGSYRCSLCFFIDSDSIDVYGGTDDGTTHKMTNATTLTVNGEAWTYLDGSYVSGSDYSTMYFYSKTYIIDEPEDLYFYNSSSYNIPLSHEGSAIATIDVSGGAEGGTAPYTFSKISGPDWLNVSAAGVISGTPTAVGNNANLEIRVTDSSGTPKTRDFTLTVARTAMDPASRTVVSSVTATSTDIDTIAVYGGEITKPTFTVTAGQPVYVWNGSSLWQKYDGEHWNNASGTFENGTYRYKVMLYIDSDSLDIYGGTDDGTTHIISSTVSFTGNGNAYTTDSSSLSTGDEYSYIYVYSPNFVISDGGVAGSISVPAMANAEVGYSELSYSTVTVNLTNTGAVDSSKMQATLSGANAEDFQLDPHFGGTLMAPDSWNNLLYVRPKTGLAAGTHTATLTLKFDADGDSVYETTIGSTPLSFTVTKKQITNIAVTVATEPAIGVAYELADFSYTTTPADVTNWYGPGTSGRCYLIKTGVDAWATVEPGAGNEFESGEEYKALVKVSAIDSSEYEFAVGCTATINGNTATVWNGGSYVEVSYSYGVLSSDELVTNVNCTITKPVAGEHPDFSSVVSDSEKYTASVSNIYLHEDPYPNLTAGDVFEAGKVYSYRIMFTPKSGYRFDSDDTTYTINGEDTSCYGGAENEGREINYTATVPTHTITINNGTSSPVGSAAEGATVTITAGEPAAGKVFDGWDVVSGGITLVDAGLESTTFTMGTADVEVTATYRDIVSMGEISTLPLASQEVGYDPLGYTAANINLTSNYIFYPSRCYAEFTGTNNDCFELILHDDLPNFNGTGMLYALAEYRPITGLAVGTYTADIEIRYDADNNGSYETLFAGYPLSFTVTPATYAVTFNVNGGTGTMDPVLGISSGASYTLPANEFTAPSGKQFKCWNVGGDEKDVGVGITITSDTVVTAVWEDIPTPTFTVTYEANGGTGTMDPVDVPEGDYILPECEFTAPAGKEFDCWLANSANHAPGETIPVFANKTITAQWKDITTPPPTTYTVSFETNGGSAVTNQIVTSGETATKPSNPTKSGYKFVNWYADSTLKTVFNFSDSITSDTTIYAKWSLVTSGGGGGGSSSSKDKEKEEVKAVWSDADDWAIEELKEAAKKDLIPETLENKDFKKKIDRTDFAAVAVKLYEALTGKKAKAVANNPFTDTNDENVLKALALGITNGTSETTFTPDEDISREQMATMIFRAIEKADIDTNIDLDKVERFADDADLHDWGRKAVYFMASKDIIKGIGENTFDALGNAKIEEAIAIALRCIEVLGK